MHKTTYLIVSIILILLLAGCAGDSRHHKASMPDPRTFNAHFGDMDTDGDDLVSWAEFKSHFPQATKEIYQELDLNGDGKVDHDEWHEFKAAHGLKHAE
jgi:major membrane immunogen (membrane-anchored lipoprotein)